MSQQHSFPTMEDVEAADRIQLAKWYRFLPSPGMSAVGQDDFVEISENQRKIMSRIIERFQEMGGFTPEISKKVGW